jgi:hypothetical protein
MHVAMRWFICGALSIAVHLSHAQAPFTLRIQCADANGRSLTEWSTDCPNASAMTVAITTARATRLFAAENLVIASLWIRDQATAHAVTLEQVQEWVRAAGRRMVWSVTVGPQRIGHEILAQRFLAAGFDEYPEVRRMMPSKHLAARLERKSDGCRPADLGKRDHDDDDEHGRGGGRGSGRKGLSSGRSSGDHELLNAAGVLIAMKYSGRSAASQDDRCEHWSQPMSPTLDVVDRVCSGGPYADLVAECKESISHQVSGWMSKSASWVP